MATDRPPSQSTTCWRGPAEQHSSASPSSGHARGSHLARVICDGSSVLDEDTTTPALCDVESLFKGLYEDGSGAVPKPDTRSPSLPLGAYTPVSAEEVDEVKKGWTNSSPGPDGVTVGRVKGCPSALLATLFNVVLYRRIAPSCWRESRTVLLPKEGNRADPSNWRPITIGPACQRLLHRILARRIGNRVSLDAQQRGFASMDGTLANVVLLDQFIGSRRLQGKCYNVVSLDVRKAFDMVPHGCVIDALRSKGVEEPLVEYILDSLHARTRIRVGEEYTGPICFRRGVRQGDRLSPLLFNIAIDALVSRLNTWRPRGTVAPGLQVGCVAFADDLVLLSDTDVNMSMMLREVTAFLGQRGMALNAQKCVSVSAASVNGKSVPRSKPVFRLGRDLLRVVADMSTYRYLGHQFECSRCGQAYGA